MEMLMIAILTDLLLIFVIMKHARGMSKIQYLTKLAEPTMTHAKSELVCRNWKICQNEFMHQNGIKDLKHLARFDVFGNSS